MRERLWWEYFVIALGATAMLVALAVLLFLLAVMGRGIYVVLTG